MIPNRFKPKKKKCSTMALKKRMFGDAQHAPCAYCGVKLSLYKATFDHVKPKSAGGYDKVKNGVICCDPCNSLKGSMSLGEFKQKYPQGCKSVKQQTPNGRAAPF